MSERVQMSDTTKNIVVAVVTAVILAALAASWSTITDGRLVRMFGGLSAGDIVSLFDDIEPELVYTQRHSCTLADRLSDRPLECPSGTIRANNTVNIVIPDAAEQGCWHEIKIRSCIQVPTQ